MILFGGNLCTNSKEKNKNADHVKAEVTGVVAELEVTRRKLKAELHKAKRQHQINKATQGEAFREVYGAELTMPPLRNNFLRSREKQQPPQPSPASSKPKRRRQRPAKHRSSNTYVHPKPNKLSEEAGGRERWADPAPTHKAQFRRELQTQLSRTAPVTAHPVGGTSLLRKKPKRQRQSLQRRQLSSAPQLLTAPLPMPKTRLDMMPILTTTGDTAFEAGDLGGPESTATLPVFRLPQVHASPHHPVKFANRLPVEETEEERLARERECEEVARMQSLLRLSDADLFQLEMDLGLREREEEEENDVGEFLHSQSYHLDSSTPSLPHLPSPSVGGTLALDRSHRRRRRKQSYLEGSQSQTHLEAPTTPRVLRMPGRNASIQELRAELGKSMGNVQNYTTAVKDDVLSVQRMLPIKGKRAKRFLRNWATEKLFGLCDDLAFSLTAIAFSRWSDETLKERRLEKLHAFLRFQGSTKLCMCMDAWRLRRLAGAWVAWIDMVIFQRRVELEELELKMAVRLQRIFRGHKARVETAILREVVRAERERRAVIMIQSLARGHLVRNKVMKLRQDMIEADAASRIQKGLFAVLLRRRGRRRLRAMKRERAAVRIQATIRRHLAQKHVYEMRWNKKQHDAAGVIQRAARARQGRKLAQLRAELMARHRAATLIQKHIRRKLAVRYAAWLRVERQKRRILEYKSAITIQRIYRGHRGRIRMHLELAQLRARHRREIESATIIQKHARRIQAKKVVDKKRKEWEEKLIADARAWKETWSEDAQAWFYHNLETGEALWEPPSTGYTKDDARLVLLTGKIIDDPDDEATQEEKEQKAKQHLCVECEEKAATRFCEQCGDQFCTACYNVAHETGVRAQHTWIRLGVIECAECEEKAGSRWCRMCDDPFCDECWDDVHAKGRRQKHTFSQIGEDGNIIGDDGEIININDSAEDSVDDVNTAEYTADYTVETYGEEYEAGEGYESAEEQEEWTRYEDDDGTPYWYNNHTGESTWDDPAAAATTPAADSVEEAEEAMDEAKAEDAATEDVPSNALVASEDEWTEYADDDGYPYWYSNVTGESTYENPFQPSAETAAAQEFEQVDAAEDANYNYTDAEQPSEVSEEVSVWAEYYDDEGYPYYYNSVTGESTYEKPEDM